MNRFETFLVHPPSLDEDGAGAVSPPIYQTATFHAGEGAKWDYSRSGNPTRRVLEEQLARMDGARRAFAYASGVTAVDAVLGLLRAGDELVVGDDLYGGTTRLIGALRERIGLVVRVVDASDEEALRRAVTDRTRLVFVESLTNPRLRRVDVARAAAIAHAKGAWLAVDNTMLSPYLERPLALGADLAVQSATKFLGGHSDLTAGVVAVSDESLEERLAFDQNARGSALAPLESWLLLRGMETLTVRIDRQLESATVLARWLRNQPGVERVIHPSLDESESATIGCAVIGFTTGDLAASERVLANTRLFRTAVSFGGVGSSISLPLRMSHASIPESDRARRAFPPDLVRLSIGLEDPGDLIADLEAALPAATPAARTRCAPLVGVPTTSP